MLTTKFEVCENASPVFEVPWTVISGWVKFLSTASFELSSWSSGSRCEHFLCKNHRTQKITNSAASSQKLIGDSIADVSKLQMRQYFSLRLTWIVRHLASAHDKNLRRDVSPCFRSPTTNCDFPMNWVSTSCEIWAPGFCSSRSEDLICRNHWIRPHRTFPAANWKFFCHCT